MSRRITPGAVSVNAFAICVLLFLYLPVVVVALWSFNTESISSFPMKGLTLRWYGEAFKDTLLVTSLANSVRVALIATFLAILIGVPGAYGMYLYKFPGKKILDRLVVLPMMLPGIITGISLLSFLRGLGIVQGPTAVILGHTTFLIGTVLPQVYARLRQLDGSMLDAAKDLGSSPVQTFFNIVLPNIRTAVLGAALLSITLSLDEIPVTYFLNGVFITLPIRIFAMTRNGFTPKINAMCSLILIFSVTAIVLQALILKPKQTAGTRD